jgi:hypothetical protein
MFCVIEEGSMGLDKPPSQETERNLNLGKYAMRRTCGSFDSVRDRRQTKHNA